MNKIGIHFSDFFGIDTKIVEDYGAFDTSLVNDVPVFIDPFRLYASDKTEYNQLHEQIIDYLRFLCRYSELHKFIDKGNLKNYFCFPEVREIYMGFCKKGNAGRGLGARFATALRDNFGKILSDFGKEKISQSSHLEKLCIICDDVGRDYISDFTANILKDYLLKYTERFAEKFLPKERCFVKDVPHAVFDFEKEIWKSQKYYLPAWGSSYVILVPRDFLTRNNTWINRDDLISDMKSLPETVGDDILKSQLTDLIAQVMDERVKLTSRQKNERFRNFYRQHPEIVDWYIKRQEGRKEEAMKLADSLIDDASDLFVRFTNCIADDLNTLGFYEKGCSSLDEARDRVLFFKKAIEDNDVYKVFYLHGKKRITEEQVQLIFRLVWRGTRLSVDREVNNGRGPVDYKASACAKDSCLVEFKLASNSQLESNLKNQLNIYKAANDTEQGLCVIVYTSDGELKKVDKILASLGLATNPNIILIDASPKTSASKVR